jgi:hypothetical protein
MQKPIEDLVKLQALDVERQQVEKALRALPAEIAKAEAELAAARNQARQTTESLAQEEALRGRLEKEVATHRQKAARYRGQLDTVTTPAQAEAMEKEIHFADSEAERLENEEFASMERTETLESTLTEAQAAVATKTLALEKTEARVAARKAEYAAQLEQLARDRAALRPQIEETLLSRFDRLSASRGTGLAKAENQLCMGCRMSIRLQVWGQLREGELLTCDSCGRLLYWDPDLSALAK